MSPPGPSAPRLTRTWKGGPIRAPCRAERIRLWVLTAGRAVVAVAVLARIGDRRTTIIVALIGLCYCWTRTRAIRNDAAAVATSRDSLDRLLSKLAGHEERRLEWHRWWRNGRGTKAVLLSEERSLLLVALICVVFLWRALQGT